MADYPPEALTAAREAIDERDAAGGDWSLDYAAELARAALDAAAPILAEACAQAILAHMEAHGPPEGSQLGTARRYVYRSHFSTAARVAASTFADEDEMKRKVVEALERGDYAACPSPEDDQ